MFFYIKKKMLKFCLVVVFMNISLVLASPGVDDRWFPNFVEAKIVSTGLNANGINIQIWQVKSSKPTAELLAYYNQLWSKQLGFLRYNTNEWFVTGYVEKKWFISLQLLKDEVDSFGYLAVSEYPNVQPSAGFNSWLQPPMGSEMITNISALDGPHKSKTLVFKNKHRVKANTDYFRKAFRAKGWVEDSIPNADEEYITLLFRRGPDNATVSINDIGGDVGGVIVLVEH